MLHNWDTSNKIEKQVVSFNGNPEKKYYKYKIKPYFFILSVSTDAYLHSISVLNLLWT